MNSKEMANEPQNNQNEVNLGQAVSVGFRLLEQDWILFLQIAVVSQLLPILNFILEPFMAKAPILLVFTFLITIASIFIAIWSTAAFFYALRCRFRDEDVMFRQAFLDVRPRYWRCVGYSFLVGVIVGIGILLFVIPGVYFGVLYVLVLPAALFGPANISPLVISKRLISGHFKQTLALCLVVNLSYLILFGIFWRVAINSRLALNVLAAFLGILYPCVVTPIFFVWYESLFHAKGHLLSETGTP